ncbi:MAG: sigma-54 interaction domain-containing protein [Gemmatimonadaceae bacterium]
MTGAPATTTAPAATSSGNATNRRALRILAVLPEDDRGAFGRMAEWARGTGDTVDVAPDLPRATRRLSSGEWDVVMIVVGGHAADELGWWVDALRGVAGAPRLVAFSCHASMGLVLQAERLGVLEVLALPPRREDIDALVQRLHIASAEAGVTLPPVDPTVPGSSGLVGRSPAMLSVYKSIARVARSSATVLVLGESGTGKELVARAIHGAGPRASGPFVAVNCAAIPENLLESELFGHEKGAFTGAIARRTGRFEAAVGGTLFLDEIADMSVALQAKILRAVQEREIERLGGSDTLPVNVRLIAATNRNLREAIEQGKFREDLYYRLSVVTIRLPRLGDRGSDLVLLTSYFAREFSREYGKSINKISERALTLLQSHEWVGNVRELRNVVERAVINAVDDVLRADHMPEELFPGEEPASNRGATPITTIAEVEARHIARVIAHTNGAIGATAAILGIHRNTLRRKMREYGL